MNFSTPLKKRVAVVSVGAAVNLGLFFLKLYIGLSTNCVAVYADAVNNFADCAVCLAVIFFTVHTAKSADEYPFGAGKAEELLDLIISAVVILTGAAFAYISLERLLYPAPVWYSGLYAALIALTAFVKLALYFFYRNAYKKLGTRIIKGVLTDSILDFFITFCTFISFTLSEIVRYSVDGAAGIVISVVLTFEGVAAARAASSDLLGKTDPGVRARVKKILEEDESVLSVSDIGVHSYGETKIFSARLILRDSDGTNAAVLSERLEEKIRIETGSKIYFSFGGQK